jgi:DNA modification methylase
MMLFAKEEVNPNGFLYAGDNLEYMRTLPDNSVDSVVTDPPYGLGKEPDPRKVLAAWLNDEEYQPGGKGFMGKEWDSFVPSPAIWQECLRVLKPGGHLIAFAGTRTYDWIVLGVRLAGFEIRDSIHWLYGSGFPKSLNVSKAIDEKLGATPEAKQWEGWGTALKPSCEPAVLARKPLEGTVAENVLKHGVGGVNVDACRSETPPRMTHKDGLFSDAKSRVGKNESTGMFNGLNVAECEVPEGRWPANTVTDGSESVVSEFPETSSGKPVGNKNATQGYEGGWGSGIPVTGFGDTGSAARFFTQAPFEETDATLFKYCAKASTSERNEGTEALQAVMEGKGNIHSTVKPVTLIEWMVKLVTPPGGTVLDPFIGSGTTGVAAELAGFRWIGCERETDYAMIAWCRICYAIENRHAILARREAEARAKKDATVDVEPEKQGCLF